MDSLPQDDSFFISFLDEQSHETIHAVGAIDMRPVNLVIVRGVGAGQDGMDLIAITLPGDRPWGRCMWARSEHYIAPSVLAVELCEQDMDLAKGVSNMLSAIQRKRQIQKAAAYVEANKVAKAGKQ